MDTLVGRSPTWGGDGGEVGDGDVSGLTVVGSAVVGGGDLGSGWGALSGWTNGRLTREIRDHGLSSARSDVGILVVDIAEVLPRARSGAIAAVDVDRGDRSRRGTSGLAGHHGVKERVVRVVRVEQEGDLGIVGRDLARFKLLQERDHVAAFRKSLDVILMLLFVGENHAGRHLLLQVSSNLCLQLRKCSSDNGRSLRFADLESSFAGFQLLLFDVPLGSDDVIATSHLVGDTLAHDRLVDGHELAHGLVCRSGRLHLTHGECALDVADELLASDQVLLDQVKGLSLLHVADLLLERIAQDLSDGDVAVLARASFSLLNGSNSRLALGLEDLAGLAQLVLERANLVTQIALADVLVLTVVSGVLGLARGTGRVVEL